MARRASERASIAGVAFLLGVGSVSTPASAQVFQVNDDGTVVELRQGEARPIDGAGDADATIPVEDAPDMPVEALTVLANPDVPSAYRDMLHRAADRYAVSPSLLAALTQQESGWRQSAISPKGAIGLTQLMPPTARELAVDARDPEANLDGGARYLRGLLDRFDGDVERALAAYNAGARRVVKANGVPAIAETRAYVATIIDRLGERIDPVRRIGR